MSDLDEDRVRAKAHALWESENRPEGRAEHHWMEAREIIALEDSYSSTLQPLEETVGDTVEPLIAVESHGDVPELTDLGDGPNVPSRKTAAQDAGASPLQPDMGGRSPKEK